MEWIYFSEWKLTILLKKSFIFQDLPPGIRNRFTEFFVDEIDNPEDLQILVMAYLHDIAPKPNEPVASVVNFYLAAKKEAAGILTGTPHCDCDCNYGVSGKS